MSNVIRGPSGKPIVGTAIGQTLVWDGVEWTPGAGGGAPSGPAGGDLSGTYPNPSVDFATAAGSADTATTAGFAGTATTADFADAATTAGFADLANTAAVASFADAATTADFATTAGFTDTANTANFATSAGFATTADFATTASFANSATTATFADSATTATFADSATTATFADSATTADFATTAGAVAGVTAGFPTTLAYTSFDLPNTQYNNINETGMRDVDVVRINPTDDVAGQVRITGYEAPSTGSNKFFQVWVNVSQTNDILLTRLDSNSDAENQWGNPGNYTIASSGGCAAIFYDNVSQVWRTLPAGLI